MAISFYTGKYQMLALHSDIAIYATDFHTVQDEGENSFFAQFSTNMVHSARIRWFIHWHKRF